MWIEPKTNWAADDYINIDDMNRIIGNITHIGIAAKPYFPDCVIPPQSDVTYTTKHTPDIINTIESRLQIANSSTVRVPDFPAQKTWEADGPFYTYEDLNRIEGATLTLYNIIIGIGKNKPVLPYEFGGWRP